jgi:hypothetical protein
MLFLLLSLLLVSLWYDYRVARPAVERAFDAVLALNFQINSAASPQTMTVRDVRRVLGKLPSATFAEGPYQVEVYSWMTGLPFRSHQFYAVYVGSGTNMTLMRHYKFDLPLDELRQPAQSHRVEAMGGLGMPRPPSQAAPMVAR